jgi:DNA-binding transcriptional ArsR family regulator
MSDSISLTFSALSDPTRRAILARLALGDTSVTELAAPFEMSMPAVSKHLRVLERAGLITQGREAQRRPCRLNVEPLRKAAAWINEYRNFWEQGFDRMDNNLQTVQAEERDGKDSKKKKKKKEKKEKRHGKHKK